VIESEGSFILHRRLSHDFRFLLFSIKCRKCCGKSIVLWTFKKILILVQRLSRENHDGRRESINERYGWTILLSWSWRGVVFWIWFASFVLIITSSTVCLHVHDFVCHFFAMQVFHILALLLLFTRGRRGHDVIENTFPSTKVFSFYIFYTFNV
jgi:hypothetical protein